jgi:hypothetical protein
MTVALGAFAGPAAIAACELRANARRDSPPCSAMTRRQNAISQHCARPNTPIVAPTVKRGKPLERRVGRARSDGRATGENLWPGHPIQVKARLPGVPAR